MNEAVRPLNKQDLNGNRTKENTVYSWAGALNWFNAVVRERRSGPRVLIRTLIAAQADGQASKEAKVRGQQTVEHKNLCVKGLFPNQKWHHSWATHVHLAVINADGANSYHKMHQCWVYCFSDVAANKFQSIRFSSFGLFISSQWVSLFKVYQEAKTEATLLFLQSKRPSPSKTWQESKITGKSPFPIWWQIKPLSWFLFTGSTHIQNTNLFFLSSTFLQLDSFPRLFSVFPNFVWWLLFKDTFKDE